MVTQDFNRNSITKKEEESKSTTRVSKVEKKPNWI